jgi:hypothetical protein
LRAVASQVEEQEEKPREHFPLEKKRFKISYSVVAQQTTIDPLAEWSLLAEF